MRTTLLWLVLLLVLTLVSPGSAVAAGPMQFWNLTGETVTSLTLAPAGSDKFGPNQCANDKDGGVDNDERLKLTGVAPGRYDVRVGLPKGRMCVVRGVELKGDRKYAFSLEPADLTDCTGP